MSARAGHSRRARPRAAASPGRRVGDAVYVNPGSVGCGYDHRQPDDDFWFDPWASYAIVDGRSVEFHTVPFDLDELDAVTRSAAMPLAGEVFDRYRRL